MKDFFEEKISRREFLKRGCILGLSLGTSGLLTDVFFRPKAYAAIGEKRGIHEAMFYRKIDEETVQCQLCPRRCILMNGQRGFCRVREPVKEKLYSLVYELPCAVHVDPIEKKPFFHVLPATTAFSIATAGCNLRCKFCQNWSISQKKPEETDNIELSCEEVVAGAVKSGSRSIAYTYTEPSVFYEYMIDTAKIAKSRGLKNLYHTGGYLNPEPAKELAKYMDAANVDLKGFDKKYLNEVCQQELEPVLTLLKTLKEEGVLVEITNLIVPTLNDNMDYKRQMASWIKQNLGPDTPLHFSRFWPQYKLRTLYPTPVAVLEEARKIALAEGLYYVYIGNIPGHEGENTFCPNCKRKVILRAGYKVLENNLQDGKCKFCKFNISGIWS